MAEWPNPMPPMSLLRLRYPKLNSDTVPLSPFAIFILCFGAATLWVAVVTPQMDGLVLKVIRTFKPSFVPFQSVFQSTPLHTERQAVERMVFRTSLLIGHLFLLWPLLIMSLLLVMEGISWVTGLNAPKYAAHLWVVSESFMVVNLLFYYGDMAQGALMLGETRQIELVDLTINLWRDREGER